MKKLTLPMNVFRVDSAQFTDEQIRVLIERTNKKLEVCGIEIEVSKVFEIPDPSLAIISDENVEEILKFGLTNPDHMRLFLVKEDGVYGYGSWTYDPCGERPDSYLWSSAIFVSEEFAESTDEHYVSLGYLSSNDSLLHELGHVLMQESEHVSGERNNFFHALAECTDDSISEEQIARLRDGKLLRKPT